MLVLHADRDAVMMNRERAGDNRAMGVPVELDFLRRLKATLHRGRLRPPDGARRGRQAGNDPPEAGAMEHPVEREPVPYVGPSRATAGPEEHGIEQAVIDLRIGKK